VGGLSPRPRGPEQDLTRGANGGRRGAAGPAGGPTPREDHPFGARGGPVPPGTVPGRGAGTPLGNLVGGTCQGRGGFPGSWGGGGKGDLAQIGQGGHLFQGRGAEPHRATLPPGFSGDNKKTPFLFVGPGGDLLRKNRLVARDGGVGGPPAGPAKSAAFCVQGGTGAPRPGWPGRWEKRGLGSVSHFKPNQGGGGTETGTGMPPGWMGAGRRYRRGRAGWRPGSVRWWSHGGPGKRLASLV